MQSWFDFTLWLVITTKRSWRVLFDAIYIRLKETNRQNRKKFNLKKCRVKVEKVLQNKVAAGTSWCPIALIKGPSQERH
jgi:hypothetical protein